jgi:hypothetical protein
MPWLVEETRGTIWIMEPSCNCRPEAGCGEYEG